MISIEMQIKNTKFEHELAEAKSSSEKNYQVKVTKVYSPNSTDWYYKVGK
jgi:hypothetical protein